VDLKELLKLSIQKKASDLHLTENSPPVLRIDGKLVLTEEKTLTKEELKKSIYGILTDGQKEKFEHDRELDFSLALEGLERFRVNIHIQKGSVEAAFRRIPQFVPSIKELGLPPSILDFARKPSGLVLITGPTGSGKTTTLYAFLRAVQKPEIKIVTIEEMSKIIAPNR